MANTQMEEIIIVSVPLHDTLLQTPSEIPTDSFDNVPLDSPSNPNSTSPTINIISNMRESIRRRCDINTCFPCIAISFLIITFVLAYSIMLTIGYLYIYSKTLSHHYTIFILTYCFMSFSFSGYSMGSFITKIKKDNEIDNIRKELSVTSNELDELKRQHSIIRNGYMHHSNAVAIVE
jgi:hypothetical protein